MKELQAQMDTILKKIGLSTGTVGERMKALAQDPRYKFAEGDKGRAEIVAFINDRLAWIRAQMPRAFNTVVNPNMEVKRLPPEEEMRLARLLLEKRGTRQPLGEDRHRRRARDYRFLLQRGFSTDVAARATQSDGAATEA